ncbi:HEXXH motif domain-containing protein [Actinoplanes sp. NPDC020271]|uniref:HEXXH motif domain-containing protein n=1 Tax=Actinoplanes sp. NPDC020271 TaxID=3363896 RepID=UPI0037AAB124
MILTPEQLDGIAAGRCTPAAAVLLRDFQLAKRKLLMWRLMAGAGGDPAMDLLIRADAASPATTADVLRHPYLDAWATHTLNAGGDLGYLGQFAAAAAVRAGLTFSVEVPVTHGGVYLPTLGEARVGGATTTVRRLADGDTLVGPVRLGGAGWADARRAELEPGFGVSIEDQEPYRDTYDFRPAGRLDAATAERLTGLLREAWQILLRRHPDHAAAIRIMLRTVVPLAARPTAGGISAASRQASGSIAFAVPDTAEELCLLILHEFRHMQLDAVRDLTDLHDRESAGRFMAPWRMDPRPAPALLQGIFAHAGVAEYWRQRRDEPGAPAITAIEYAYWRRQSRIALDALAGSGELTEVGERFTTVLRETLDSWPADDPPEVAAMVRAQTIRWRLRNWRPAPGEVDAVVKAWRDGRTPEGVGFSGVLRGDADGEPSGIPGIVGVIRRALAGAEIGDPADRLFLSGDRAGAAALYATALDSDDDWVKFMLATGDPVVRQRPDLFRAVARELGADPVRLAGWFGACHLTAGRSGETVAQNSRSI